MTRPGNPVQVGLLVKTYPKLSETFILSEILGLEARELNLHLFSIHAPTDDKAHDRVELVRAGVSYLPDAGLASLPRLLAANLRLMLRRPGRYIVALRRAGPGFLTAGWLADSLVRHSITHIHAHFASDPATLADLAASLAGVSFSISAHAKDIYLSAPDDLRAKLERAAFTITCTEHNRRYLQQLAPTGTRVHRMYHSVDAELFRRRSLWPTAVPTPEPVPTILSIGRLRPKKGFDTLIHACAMLAGRGVEFRCDIIGYGPEQQRLASLIEESGLQDRVRLLGKLTHSAVILHYRLASAFVLPCRLMPDGDRDGIPNVLLEAMAMQLPVVSTNVSGIPEAVIDGHNGLLVPPDDPTRVAATIERLLGDQRFCEQLGRNARDIVIEKFSDGNVEQLVGLLRSPLTEGDSIVPARMQVAHE